MSRRFLFIVNPAAGRTPSTSVCRWIDRELSGRNVTYDVRETTEPGEATQLAEQAAEEVTHVVAVGGDGTANEVVNGIMGTSVGFGLVPAGSGNDFSKAVGIPTDVRKAVDLLQHGDEKTVDVGRHGARYFINGMGIGMDGVVAHRFRRFDRSVGKCGYAYAAFREALSYPGFEADLACAGKRYRGHVLFCSISNGPVQGGGFRMAPEASVDDGLLDVQVTRYMSPLRRLINGPRWMRGTQARLRDLEVRQEAELTLRTASVIHAHMDGEPLFLENGTHHFAVVEGGLDVICS